MLELLKGSIQTKSADLEVIYHHINRHLLRFCQFLNFLYQFGNLIRPESCEFLLTVKIEFSWGQHFVNEMIAFSRSFEIFRNLLIQPSSNFLFLVI